MFLNKIRKQDVNAYKSENRMLRNARITACPFLLQKDNDYYSTSPFHRLTHFREGNTTQLLNLKQDLTK